MKYVIYPLLILLSITLSGCENPTIEDENVKDNDKGNDKNITSSYFDELEPLTIEEAQAAEIGTVICVDGYIVASCTRSIGNVVFCPPFEGSTAVVMAAEPVDPETFMYTDDDLFPVCLTDYKDVRAAMNLEDNPELWNRHVRIVGVKKSYMGLPGMKMVLGFRLMD